ncbi:DNA polymerase [Dictyocaulus viviparus]|uniref:DNA polymerase n=1 Tax=Dictyocaulus viviparus TaxID=29172 RepID=A0A0D8Y845_DICVI|nr:DNA polymerase [Dictyocaulus viviparus]
MLPLKRKNGIGVAGVLTKKRKVDETLSEKGAFECHLEHLSQTSEHGTSFWNRQDVEEGLGIEKSIAFQENGALCCFYAHELRNLYFATQNFTEILYIKVFDVETYHEPGSATMFDKTNVKLYGVTRKGNSVCSIITDYFPHFYFQAPDQFAPEHLDVAQRNLNNAIATVLKKANTNFSASSTVVDNLVHLSIVYGENVYYYRGSEKKYPFIKVSGTTNALNKAKHELRNGGISFGSRAVQVGTLYEANIDAEVKFMAKSGIVGCGWVEIPIGKGKIINKSEQSSRCQIEVEVKLKDLLVHEPEGIWSDVAPIRTLSFDIECMGRRGIFPDANEDSVIQIANMVKVEGESEPFIRNCFVLGTCSPVIGSEIIQCDSEKELLESWAEFVRTVDPDIITGYNILNFDLPYILDRAKVLKLPSVAMLGRQRDRASGVRDAAISSKQMGSRVNKSIDIHGRIIFDVLQVVLRDYKLRSYTLNSVSYHFLQEQKEDVEHSIISDLQRGDEYTRRRLAVYCMKDAVLPLRLLEKLLSVINYMEMARVTGVPLNYLLTRGQQIKILSMMLRKCKSDNFFLPVIDVQGGESEGYEGATVIEPLRGFYNEPIATLDFASLYPSIMIAHNLCYTTLLKTPEGDYIRTPSGNYFATRNRRRGLLPVILEDLLAARKRAKNEMKNERDDFRKMVLNGRQLALKISANSVYGFTGATVGKLPCLEISQSVTAFGREMIDLTKSEVEKRYVAGSMEGKCPANAQVIYGDTDSVMVKFGVKTVAEAMEIGLHAATEVSKIFTPPIKLEFEKVYFPYLLINKKRYAGLYFTNPNKHDKMDCKGLETVRRDNCPLVAKVLNTCLEKLMIARDATSALEFAKRVISDLLCNKIDISLLIISKELTKSSDKYQAKQAHVELAARMRKRDPGSAPRLGDRVPYVIIASAKNVPAYEKAEDPTFVLKNNIPIDTKHYLTNQLAKPLARIFEPILGDRAERMLIEGEHTRVRTVVQSKVGGLVAFTKKQVTCLGCKAVLKNQSRAVCDFCISNGKLPEIYAQRVSSLNILEKQFSRLWTECQNCAKTMHDKVSCSACDCPIYYMREKVRGDLKEAYSALDRFGDSSW